MYIWKELFVDILYYWPFGFMDIALMFIQLWRGLKSLPYLSRTQTPFAKGFRENKVVFRIYRSIKRLIDQPIAKRSVNHKSKKKKMKCGAAWTALRWTLPGKRNKDRPKTTCRWTVTTELKEIGLKWGEAQHEGKDRPIWRQIIDALCPSGDKKD